MKLVPLGDKVVVKPVEAEEKTAGGIVLPDVAREKPRQGRVLSIGDGRLLPNGTRVPHEVREGDRVIFSKYSGSEVQLGSDEFLIMGEDDILAVVG